MTLDLAERTCIVTGAAQGIGAAEARLLAKRGALVLCVDRADPSATVDVIRETGGRAVAWRGDVTDHGAAEAIIATAAELSPLLAVLVSNAGIVRDRMSFNLTDDDWDAVIAVNLTAPSRLCREAVRHWRRAALGESPWAGMASKIEPSPTSFQGTIVGSGVHGVWDETRSISAVTGRCAAESSSRWNAARLYWSGVEA